MLLAREGAMDSRRDQNKQLRKQFELRQQYERVRTEPRSLTADVQIQGIGGRRLQLVFRPSFSDGHTWDVRQLGEVWSVFQSRIDNTSGKALGYELLAAESSKLAELFDDVCSVSLPLRPDLSGHGGLDGTGYQLAVFGDLSSSITIHWWSNWPEQWAPLIDIAERAMEYFSGLPAIEFDLS